MMRRLLAVPSSVLVICLFLPALRVCGHAEVPATFPPCYAAYLGGIGVVIVALARVGASRLAAFGAAIPLAFIALTTGGLIAVWAACTGPIGSAIGIALGLGAVAAAVAIVRACVRKPPSEVTMATIALGQAIVSIGWTGLLAFDREGMWGSYLALVAALAMAVGSLAWRSDAARRERDATNQFPRAFARRLHA